MKRLKRAITTAAICCIAVLTLTGCDILPEPTPTQEEPITTSPDMSASSGQVVELQKYTGQLQIDTITSYYMQLDSSQKKIYDFIYDSVSNLKTGYLDVASAVGKPVVASEFSDIMTYVALDHPELYWFPTTFAYQYKSGDLKSVYNVSFTDAYQFHELGQKSKTIDDMFTTSVNEVYKAIPEGTNSTKAEWMAQTLMGLAEYDTNEANYRLEQSAYSVFCMDKTICGGWSKAYKLLCDKANISCSILFLPIKDYNGKEFYHAFNIISVDNKEVCVDLTNDFTVSDDLSYKEYVQMLARHGWYVNE